MPRHRRFGLLRFRSPLLAESLLFSSPGGNEMFQFPPFAPAIRRAPCLQHGGLPHSEIRASTAICASTRLFAAYHVLLRLPEPRHPPSALIRFFLLVTFTAYRLSCMRLAQFLTPVSRQGNRAFLVQYVNDLLLSRHKADIPVENKGLEPLTLCVQGRCSKPTELIPRSRPECSPRRI